MKKSQAAGIACAYFLFALSSCTQPGELVVKHQMSGPYTNSYLLYDTKSRETAIFDIGGPIDSLLSVIDEKNLIVKYILFTHGHIDHLMGWPSLQHRFPEAQVCLNRLDYEDMQVQLDWIYVNIPEEVPEWKQDPEVAKFFDFEPETFEEPDIYVEDSQTFHLGQHQIEAIHAPGHSRGSICYHAGDFLFSGDVLMYRSAGRDDFQNSSPEELKRSIQKLFEMFPEETVVYPGHGPATDIGSEKRENKYVPAEEL